MTDSLHQMIYATDASAYREMPLAVVYPRDASDVKECIKFARKNGITLIPRAAGTSLAGQVDLRRDCVSQEPDKSEAKRS